MKTTPLSFFQVYFQNLVGEWAVQRTLSDGTKGQGTATFSAINEPSSSMSHHVPSNSLDFVNTWLFKEHLQLTLPHQTALKLPIKGEQAYCFSLTPQALNLIFSEGPRSGQIYVSMPLLSIKIGENPLPIVLSGQHHCGADIYTHRIHFKNSRTFTTQTIITGPAKELNIQSFYEKV